MRIVEGVSDEVTDGIELKYRDGRLVGLEVGLLVGCWEGVSDEVTDGRELDLGVVEGSEVELVGN